MARFIIFSMLCLALLFGQASAQEATSEKYKEILDTWLGSSEKNLIDSWGIPDSFYELSINKKLILYKDSKLVITGGGYPDIINFYCNTTFTLERVIITEWKITEWKAEGNKCRAK